MFSSRAASFRGANSIVSSRPEQPVFSGARRLSAGCAVEGPWLDHNATQIGEISSIDGEVSDFKSTTPSRGNKHALIHIRRIDRLARQSQLQHLNLIFAVKHFSWEQAFGDDSYAAKCDAHYHGYDH